VREDRFTCFLALVSEKKDTLIDFCKKITEDYKRDHPFMVNRRKFKAGSHGALVLSRGTKCPSLLTREDLFFGKKKEGLELVRRMTSKETVEEMNSLGIPFRLNFLLYGHAGGGKSHYACAIAAVAHADLITISDITDIESAMDTCPERAVILWEDVDAMTYSREEGSRNEKDTTHIPLSTVLNTVDGDGKYVRIHVYTTNKIGALDPALIRPDRITMRIEFKTLTKEETAVTVNIYFPKADADAARELFWASKKEGTDAAKIVASTDGPARPPIGYYDYLETAMKHKMYYSDLVNWLKIQRFSDERDANSYISVEENHSGMHS
jgi:hypothetical protein